MSVAGIGGVPPLTMRPSFLSTPAADASAGTSAAAGTGSASGAGGFGNVLTQAVDGLQSTKNASDSLAVQAATGSLTDVHSYLIASTEASMATQLTVAVRNKALEAFNEIMRMPV